jgi:hypothetical protein
MYHFKLFDCNQYHLHDWLKQHTEQIEKTILAIVYDDDTQTRTWTEFQLTILDFLRELKTLIQSAKAEFSKHPDVVFLDDWLIAVDKEIRIRQPVTSQLLVPSIRPTWERLSERGPPLRRTAPFFAD